MGPMMKSMPLLMNLTMREEAQHQAPNCQYPSPGCQWRIASLTLKPRHLFELSWVPGAGCWVLGAGSWKLGGCASSWHACCHKNRGGLGRLAGIKIKVSLNLYAYAFGAISLSFSSCHWTGSPCLMVSSKANSRRELIKQLSFLIMPSPTRRLRLRLGLIYFLFPFPLSLAVAEN